MFNFGDFDPKVEFAMPEGVSNELDNQTKDSQMYIIAKLIASMSLVRASSDKMARAVKHSMVLVDAQKCNLDWKASEQKFGIKELIEEYLA